MFDFDSFTELMKVTINPKEYSNFVKNNRIGRDKVGTLIVSTVVTLDMGPETAIIDKNGTHPVQRYSDKIEAEQGHKEWVEKAKTIEKVTKLGYGGLIDEIEITLER